MNENNIILNQIDASSIKEIKPPFISQNERYQLSYADGKVIWYPHLIINPGRDIHISAEDFTVIVDASVDTRVIIDNRLKDTSIFYNSGRVGIGRAPLYSYKFDIGVPENTLMTAFHVGDGTYGFSMGNGTTQGFIPEIIGMGSDENDAGLYFLGRAGNNIASSIPLIILDGRNYLHKTVTNRPLLGVTNAQYDNYELIIDYNGNVGLGKKPEIYKLEVSGKIEAHDFILDSSVSMRDLIDILVEQKEEINRLYDKIQILENSLT